MLLPVFWADVRVLPREACDATMYAAIVGAVDIVSFHVVCLGHVYCPPLTVAYAASADSGFAPVLPGTRSRCGLVGAKPAPAAGASSCTPTVRGVSKVVYLMPVSALQTAQRLNSRYPAGGRESHPAWLSTVAWVNAAKVAGNTVVRQVHLRNEEKLGC